MYFEGAIPYASRLQISLTRVARRSIGQACAYTRLAQILRMQTHEVQCGEETDADVGYALLPPFEEAAYAGGQKEERKRRMDG